LYSLIIIRPSGVIYIFAGSDFDAMRRAMDTSSFKIVVHIATSPTVRKAAMILMPSRLNSLWTIGFARPRDSTSRILPSHMFRDMFPNNLNAVAKHEPLVRIGRNSGIKCGMTDSNARRRRNDPPNMLVMSVP
jgi:hypothetical protein